MKSWSSSTKSTVIRIAVSAPTLGTVAAFVGAGFKWV